MGPLAVEAGIFAFLLLVVTSSVGRRAARRATANRLVLIGFVPLIVVAASSAWSCSQFRPRRDMDPARLSAFDTIMGGTPRIWLGGILAYGISTFLNVTIFSRLKAREGAGLLWLRAGDRQRAEPDRRHADLHHRRLLRRVPDRRAAARPDAGQGRAVGGAGAAAGLWLRRRSESRSTRPQIRLPEHSINSPDKCCFRSESRRATERGSVFKKQRFNGFAGVRLTAVTELSFGRYSRPSIPIVQRSAGGPFREKICSSSLLVRRFHAGCRLCPVDRYGRDRKAIVVTGTRPRMSAASRRRTRPRPRPSSPRR